MCISLCVNIRLLFSWLKLRSGIAKSHGRCIFHYIRKYQHFLLKWLCRVTSSAETYESSSFSISSPTPHNVLFVCSLAFPVNEVLSHSSFNSHFPGIVDCYCWAFVSTFWPFLHLSFKSSSYFLLSCLLLFLLP